MEGQEIKIKHRLIRLKYYFYDAFSSFMKIFK